MPAPEASESRGTRRHALLRCRGGRKHARRGNEDPEEPMRFEAAAHGSTCTCRAGFVRAGEEGNGRRAAPHSPEGGGFHRGMWRRQEGGDTWSARMTMIVLSVGGLG
jgi:hypothetical protein